MQLSPSFSLSEMTRTSHRLFLNQNEPSKEQIERAGIPLCRTLLQPIRDHFARPLVIHSGFRSPLLNESIGGAQHSQHCRFEAADFHVPGVDMVEVFEWIWKESGLEWGQLILEGYQKGKPSWIHISLGAPWRSAPRCGEVLQMDGGKWKTLFKR